MVWYIKSSNTARLRLKPEVLTLARLLEITSILVCCDSRPVFAIHRERIIVFPCMSANARRMPASVAGQNRVGALGVGARVLDHLHLHFEAARIGYHAHHGFG